MTLPTYHNLFNPLLQAIKRLGGSAAIPELNEEVIKNLGLTEEEIVEPHGDRGTKLEYRLAWARSYLKAYGLLDNSERGIWTLTPTGSKADSVDSEDVRRVVRHKSRSVRQSRQAATEEFGNNVDGLEAEAVLEQGWREELLATVLNLHAATFERLCQRLLRESGFVQVKVTGRTGDGGIDGVGIIRLGGLLGFPVLFQCKRYAGTVSSSAIRDFRGAIIGRADRGLVLTTGTFSRDARIEAVRDGAQPIDLVDGQDLVDKLKELRLGVEVKMIEDVVVLPDWFASI